MLSPTMTIKDLDYYFTAKGGMLLGEPFVELQSKHDLINFNIFVTYPTHGVHFTIYQADVYNNSNSMNSISYNFSDIVGDEKIIIPYSQFVEKYSDYKIFDTTFFRDLPQWDTIDSLKLYLGKRVLDYEHGIIYRNRLHLVLENFSTLMKLTNNSHVEHCIYLAKLNSLDDISKDYFEIPLQWLIEAYPLDKTKYTKISLPYYQNEKFSAERKTSPI